MSGIIKETIQDIFMPNHDRLRACLDLVKAKEAKENEIKKTAFNSFIMMCQNEIFSVPIFKQTGIYFLLYSYSVVYVGQSKNVYARIYTHLAEGKKRFDAAWAYACDYEKLDKLEAAFIGLLRPEYNFHGSEYVCNDRQAFLNYGPILQSLVEENNGKKR